MTFKIKLKIDGVHHRWQADVETVHDIVEREFFEIETFKDNADLFNKILSHTHKS